MYRLGKRTRVGSRRGQGRAVVSRSSLGVHVIKVLIVDDQLFVAETLAVTMAETLAVTMGDHDDIFVVGIAQSSLA